MVRKKIVFRIYLSYNYTIFCITQLLILIFIYLISIYTCRQKFQIKSTTNNYLAGVKKTVKNRISFLNDYLLAFYFTALCLEIIISNKIFIVVTKLLTTNIPKIQLLIS